MKQKAYYIILLIIITACLAAVFALDTGITTEDAYADSFSITVQKITATSNGAEVTIGEQVWGSNVKIYYTTNAPYIKFFMTSKTGWSYTSDFITPNGTYVLGIPQEGMITVVARVYSNHQMPQEGQDAISQVYMDSSLTQEPDIDLTALNSYHIDQFSLRYRIYKDNFSGVNFGESWLEFIAEKAEDSIERISLALLIPNERRDLDNYVTIKNNGVLTIFIVDNAGNGKDYSYVYSKHGVPQTGKPTITLSTKEFAKSVTVTITWGAGYDDNPFAEKKYAIITPSGPVPYDYRWPIEITAEGKNQILIYYYDNGEKKYITETIDNVDKTPPSLSIMQDSASISCNVMEKDPVVFLIKATDRLSGIKRVFFKTGGNLEALENGYFSAPILDMRNFTVVAEDYAGNKTEYIYHNNYFDFTTLKENNVKYLALNRNEYTAEGWAEIEKACNAFSMLLLNEMAQSSDIAAASRAIDTAIAGEIKITNRIGTIPPGLDGGITFNLSPSATDARKGETISIRFDKVASDNLASKAGSLSGIKKRKVYPFSVTITGAKSDVKLTGDMAFNMPLPQGAVNAKLYVDAAGELVQIVSEVREGKIYATTSVLGDIYLVAEMGGNEGLYIGGKLYSWSLLAITGSIIVGVCVVGFVVSYIILKKRGSSRE